LRLSAAEESVAKAKPRKPTRKPTRKPGRTARATRPASRSSARSRSSFSDAGVVKQHLDYTTQALDQVKHFYVDLLGFKRAVHDPQFNYLVIETTPGSSIGFMPPMESAPDSWMPPKEPNLYLQVRNVDAAYARLSARGVHFEAPPQDMPWMHRVIRTRDPEGRTVWLWERIQGPR
jgi:predicted enzyme related to lactoylglutathione lyase